MSIPRSDQVQVDSFKAILEEHKGKASPRILLVDMKDFPPPRIDSAVNALRLTSESGVAAVRALLSAFTLSESDPSLPPYDTREYWEALFTHPQKAIEWQGAEGVQSRKFLWCEKLGRRTTDKLLSACRKCGGFYLTCCKHKEAKDWMCHHYQAIFVEGVRSENGKAEVTAGVGGAFGKKEASQWSFGLRTNREGVVPTSQRAELIAALTGLEMIDSIKESSCVEFPKEKHDRREYVLVTSSDYVHKGITEWYPVWKRNGWRTSSKKTPSNLDLFHSLNNRLLELEARGAMVGFWHVDREFNSLAERLAEAGEEKCKLGKDETGFIAALRDGRLAGTDGYVDVLPKSRSPGRKREISGTTSASRLALGTLFTDSISLAWGRYAPLCLSASAASKLYFILDGAVGSETHIPPLRTQVFAALGPVAWGTAHPKHTSKQVERRGAGTAKVVPLGAAGEYTMFSATGVTVGANSQIVGQLGIYPSTVASITLPGGLVGPTTGGYYTNYLVFGDIWGPTGGDTQQVASDIATAFSNARAQLPSGLVDQYPSALALQTFTPGVYVWSTAVTVAAGGTTTLKGALGDVFVMRATSLAVAANGNVVLTGGVTFATVFWVFDSTFSAGADAVMSGIILATTTASFGATGYMLGRILAGTTITFGAGTSISDCPDNRAATCSGSTSLTCFPGWRVSNGVCVVATYAPSLGAAHTFALLGTTAVTIGAAALITGNAGIANPIAAFTVSGGLIANPNGNPGEYKSFSPLITGTVFDNAAPITSTAFTDWTNARDAAGLEYPNDAIDFYPVTLGGQFYTPGVYRWSATCSMAASTTLTLTGPAGSIFILQMPSFGGGAGATVNLVGGVTSATVYWVVGTSFTAGANANIAGQILAGTAATLAAAANLDGGLYAETAITLGAGATITNNAELLLTASGAARRKRSKPLPPRWDRPVVRAKESSRVARHMRRKVHQPLTARSLAGRRGHSR
ncbi:hypothetical protein P7C70_g1298, partial [Phenoliferia sp. Uapishka_3]